MKNLTLSILSLLIGTLTTIPTFADSLMLTVAFMPLEKNWAADPGTSSGITQREDRRTHSSSDGELEIDLSEAGQVGGRTHMVGSGWIDADFSSITYRLTIQLKKSNEGGD